MTARRITRTVWPPLVIGGALAFLYGPALVTAILSFNRSPITGFPIRGLTVRWYSELWNDPQFRQSALLSLKVAALATLLGVVFGTAAAIGVSQSKSRIARTLSSVYVLPLLIPHLVLAIAISATFRLLNIRLAIWTVVAGHVVLTAPIVYLFVIARLRGFDWTLPSAARVLGASRRQAFLRVTGPLLAPAILGSAILAFVISMDNFVFSLFLTSGPSTLPLLIWSRMRESFDPSVNALATSFIALTLLAAFIVERLARLGANE